MIRTLTQLKAEFTNGKMPDQSAFSDLIDTLGQVYSLNNNTEQFLFLGNWVYQANHGFLAGQLVCCIKSVENSAGVTTPIYTLASATNQSLSVVAGLVYTVQDSNNFFLVTQGMVQLSQVALAEFLDPTTYTTPAKLIAGATYYLSDVVPGTVKIAPPTTTQHYIVQVCVAQTTGDISINTAATATIIINILNLGSVPNLAVLPVTGTLFAINGTANTIIAVGNTGGNGFNSSSVLFYIGGSFLTVNGTTSQLYLTRCKYSGSNTGLLALDTTGIVPGFGTNGPVYGLLASNAGDIVVGGQFSTYYNPTGTVSSSCLIRLNVNPASADVSGFGFSNFNGLSAGIIRALAEVGVGSVINGSSATGLIASGAYLEHAAPSIPPDTSGIAGITLFPLLQLPLHFAIHCRRVDEIRMALDQARLDSCL